MKKFPVIVIMLAIISASAFAAEGSMGGSITTSLAEGNSIDGATVGGFGTGMGIWGSLTTNSNNMGIQAGIFFAADQNTRFNFDGITFNTWWQPATWLLFNMGMDTSKHWVGSSPGYWAGANMTGWGFQMSDLAISPAFDGWNGYPGNVLSSDHGFIGGRQGDYAFSVSLLPVQRLAVCMAWNIGGPDTVTSTKSFYENFSAQVNYQIPAAGKVALSFNNAPRGEIRDLGFSYRQEIGMHQIEGGVYLPLYDATFDQIRIINAGAGFRFNGSGFWVSVRTGLQLPVVDYITTTRFGFDVCPFFNFRLFNLWIPMGIGIISSNSPVLGWSVNPYIEKNLGSISLSAGFYVYNGANNWEIISAASKDKINYAFKIGLGF